MTESSRGVENLSAVFAYLQYTRVSRWNSYEVLPVEVIDKDVFEKDVSFELCPPSYAQKQVNREYHRKIDKGEGQMATAIFGVYIHVYKFTHTDLTGWRIWTRQAQYNLNKDS